MTFSVSLPSSGWSGGAQTVQDERFIADGYVYLVAGDSASFWAYANAMIYADEVTTDGQMTFHYSKAPTANLKESHLETIILMTAYSVRHNTTRRTTMQGMRKTPIIWKSGGGVRLAI